MKKFLLIGALVVLAIVVAGAAGLAYAQGQNPPSQFGPGMMGGRGGGMMGGRGSGMMGGFAQGQTGNGTYGPMHTYMITALADKLGLTVEDLQAQIAAGQTPYQIAQAQGLSEEEITTLFAEAHDTALAAAVADGVLTQEQADWMDSHMESMWGSGLGAGMMGGRGMMSGSGMMGGSGQGFGPCHGNTTTQP